MCADRSIPAYAGEPSVANGPPARCLVYPRVCGGTKGRAASGGVNEGLSPRMRGNRSDGWHGDNGWRSIPAYAGEPYRGRGGAKIRTVYPRVCGGTPAGRRRQM